jgi:hypothetical protein
MARTDDRRNVVIIVAQDGATWHGRGVHVENDGTLALGTAKTSTVGREDLLGQLVQSSGAANQTPENSALYHRDEVLEIVYAPVHVVDALPA